MAVTHDLTIEADRLELADDTTYTWGRLTRDGIEQWAALTNLLATVDDTGEFYEVDDLAEELDETGFDPEQDSWAVWAGDQLVAYGQLRVSLTLDHDGRARCSVAGGVHPDHRRRGIGGALMTQMEARAQQLAAERHPGAEGFWRGDGGLEGSSVRAMLAGRGYEIVRYFNEMKRPVPGEPITVPAVDATLVSPADEHEEAVRVAHNLAFRDHWGSAESTPESWHDHWTARSGRPAVSTLALGPDGEVLAYVLVGQWVDREAYVNIVGSVPAARGRGLAAACLARTIDLLARSGDYDTVDLHVDSVSPTGATRLYERVGFTLAKTFAAMQKDFPAAG